MDIDIGLNAYHNAEFYYTSKKKVRATPESSSSSLLLTSLELSDTTVYAPQIRARLGTAAHFCEVVVLKFDPWIPKKGYQGRNAECQG